MGMYTLAFSYWPFAHNYQGVFTMCAFIFETNYISQEAMWLVQVVLYQNEGRASTARTGEQF